MNTLKSSRQFDPGPDPSTTATTSNTTTTTTTTSTSSDADPDPETTAPRCHPLHAPTPPPAAPARFRNASSSSRTGPPPAHSPAPTSTATTVVSSHDAQAGGPQKSKPHRRRSTLPFSFPFFQVSSNTSVTSLVPSTAEGKPIPLDDSTAAHRTSALRELNSNFPSPVARHQYTRPSGPQSSTYSQPVIVRTYSGPHASRGHSRSNSHAGRRGTISTTSTSVSYVSPPAHSRPPGPRQYGGFLNMGRGNAKKKMPWPFRQGQQEPHPADRLPPYEAFSFKTIMANLQAQSNEMDKALDGIAEIYARSRYSLSNQYEVHVAPHGSGASFISSVPSSSTRRRGHARNAYSQSGPTLQAIQSDDDDNSASARSQRRRRNTTGRRRSGAYNTLETIMSSSRSSEEDKSKKKSAAELAEQVRGRASSKPSRSGSGSPSSSAQSDNAAKQDEDPKKSPARRRSRSFANAIMFADTNKNQTGDEIPSPRSSSAALVSAPSKPQTSSSHLEIRTTPNDLFGDASTQGSQPDTLQSSSDQTVTHYLQSLTPREDPQPSSSLISGLGNWNPFKSAFANVTATSQAGATPASPSHAEGSLRDLLKTVDIKQKGKSVEHVE